MNIPKVGLVHCLLVWGALLSTSQAGTTPPLTPMAEIYGEVHAGGKYSLKIIATENVDYLNEGIDRLEQLGTRVAKIWVTRNPKGNYPDFSRNYPWLGTFSTIVDVLDTPQYRMALDRADIKTYILVGGDAPGNINFKDGMTALEISAVKAELKAATQWLVQRYAGTNKTFIFLNWEADNHLKLKEMPETQWQTAADGMAAWINARQAGVTEGRAGATGVKVLYACEINYNPGTKFDVPPGSVEEIPIPEEWCVVNSVLPNTTCDLYSWSNWASKVPGDEYKVIRGLDYYRKKLAAAGKWVPGNILMGEFGAYEAHFMPSGVKIHTTASDAGYSEVLTKQLDYAWRWGVKYAVHWQIYDNGFRNEVPSGSFDANNPYSQTEDKMVGTWLIRPASSPAGQWYFTTGYTFTTAYTQIQQFLLNGLRDDELANFNYVHFATLNGWAFATTQQPWCQGDTTRVYRASGVQVASLTYKAPENIVDFNVRAFLSSTGTATPTGRLRWYASPSGSAWTGPYEFAVKDSFKPDETAAPTWSRMHLGPGAAIPAGTKYVKFEMYDAGNNTITQIGSVKLVTQP